MHVALRLLVELHQPLGPHQPRPGGRPKYIDPLCPIPGCRKPLQLDDVLDGFTESPWHDEWSCPEHRDVILIDHPTEQVAKA
mgnify:CR=1 FL=1